MKIPEIRLQWPQDLKSVHRRGFVFTGKFYNAISCHNFPQVSLIEFLHAKLRINNEEYASQIRRAQRPLRHKPFFEATCKSDHIINLTEDDPEATQTLLYWMYENRIYISEDINGRDHDAPNKETMRSP